MTSRKYSIRNRKKSKRINYLKNVIAVQDITKKYGKAGKGYSQVWVFENIIEPNSLINISYGTFCNYLGVSGARTELKKLMNNDCGSTIENPKVRKS